MTSAPLTIPADAYAPDTDRDGPDAPACMPAWVAYLLALVIRFILVRRLGAHSHYAALAAWLHDRPDLPAGSMQALAASLRGEFGNVIAWMCRRRGIGPGHADWPELSRAIVMFGGSVKGFRPGLPARGLHWWENPNIVPGMIGETAARPAATAMASLLSRQAMAEASPPASYVVPAAAAPAVLPAIRRQVFARTAIGPPTGPPCTWGYQPLASDERGQPMAGPAVLIRADRKSLPDPARQLARTLGLIPA